MKRDMLSQALSAIVIVAATISMAKAHEALPSKNEPPPVPDAALVEFRWDVKIPLRDGIHLSATVYTPRNQKAPAPCVFTLTPYIAQSYHDRGIYFAARGYPFLTVDVRGRGNSEGQYDPLMQEARDGYDVVEWLAKQPYCNGKITMWGGSYAGYDQWATAKEFPPHLATIVPVAAPYAGVDFPMRNNIFYPYDLQWLAFTSGHTSQDKIFGDSLLWGAKNRLWFESGAPFKDLDTQLGIPSPIFQRWIEHPHPDAFWDAYNPTAEQYARLAIPILTITGAYDGDQPGALTHYREYMKNASAEGRARHYLIIGPWDHAATRTPRAEIGGLKFEPASLVDLPQLHLEWYAWTMQNGPKPQFLQKPVAYYVMGAERWRYADTLEAVTSRSPAYFLDSNGDASDVLAAGALRNESAKGKPDHYVYDPRDLSGAEYEATSESAEDLTDQHQAFAQVGKQLVYHTAPFEKDTEISGFFKLSAWIGIDQPDTDFSVTVFEIRPDGRSITLTSDLLRARYRESWRKPTLITTHAALRYNFDRFTFVSRRIGKGSRLRLIVSPINSIFTEKNYNAAGEVSQQSMKDARSVVVTLYHDRAHPSALYVPFGQP
jgi:putative CocE/NonD family hydrolase